MSINTPAHEICTKLARTYDPVFPTCSNKYGAIFIDAIKKGQSLYCRDEECLVTLFIREDDIRAVLCKDGHSTEQTKLDTLIRVLKRDNLVCGLLLVNFNLFSFNILYSDI